MPKYIKELPIWKELGMMYDTLMKHNTVNVNTETASGKTTGISMYMLIKLLNKDFDCEKIFISIPKISAAMRHYEYAVQQNPHLRNIDKLSYYVNYQFSF